MNIAVKNQYTFIYNYPSILNSFEIKDDRIKHQSYKVLRRRIGDNLLLIKGEGKALLVIIQEINKNYLLCKPIKELNQKKDNLDIHLIVGTPKKEALKDIIKYSTQIGVSSISIVDMEYSQVSNKNYKSKQEYWNNIIKESVEQSQRFFIPMLIFPTRFEEIVKNKPLLYTADIIENTEIKGLLQIIRLKQDSYYFLIGPEGGISQKERETLLSYNNYFPFILSSAILRVETATLYTLVSAKTILSSQILE